MASNKVTKMTNSKFTVGSGTLGSGITYNVDANGICTLMFDLGKRLGPSSTGKSIGVATTSGNVEIPGSNGVKLGLNAYVKADPQ